LSGTRRIATFSMKPVGSCSFLSPRKPGPFYLKSPRWPEMKFALVNPNWTFEGSTYFGCREPHYPLELLFAQQRLRAAGHDALLLDAHLKNWTTEDSKRRLDSFNPDFLVIPTAPSYLFWRCPQPELR